MGTGASKCTVQNKAIHPIDIDVYGPNDSQGLNAEQRIRLLPGQSTDIKLRKIAFLRLSGRRINLLHVKSPG